MPRISDREYTCRPDDDRLLGTVLYEELSPLEMVRDAELGIRASEMLDTLEDAMTITFYCDKAGLGWRI
jgi:hypothetical protein